VNGLRSGSIGEDGEDETTPEIGYQGDPINAGAAQIIHLLNSALYLTAFIKR
jgi:hypothetical protein